VKKHGSFLVPTRIASELSCLAGTEQAMFLAVREEHRACDDNSFPFHGAALGWMR
jgi:hypothetical protein